MLTAILVITQKTKKMERINVSEIASKARVLDTANVNLLLKADMMMFFSWGCTEIAAIQHENTPRLTRLTVNGLKHNGYVYIALNGADLFDVYITQKDGEIKTTLSDLYFDELASSIDYQIESGVENYKEEAYKAITKNLNK
jgi:hypothetical protein